MAYADYDLILDCLTSERGKIAAIAKNAKKSKKRFAGILEPFSCLEAAFATPQKNKNGLLLLTEATLSQPFASIRSDIEKTAYASYWSEIINRWIEEGGEQPGLFELYHHVLFLLDNNKAAAEKLSILFQIRFLALAGMSPNLHVCGICRAGIEERTGNQVLFDVGRGGLVCSECLKKNTPAGHRLPLSRGTVKQLIWMKEGNLEKAGRIQLSKTAQKEGLAALELFVPYHLAMEIKSLSILQSLRKWREAKR